MSIRLSFNQDDVIYFDSNGDYEVADAIELPLMLERFEVVDNAIVEIDEYKSLSNIELTTLLQQKENFKVEDVRVELKKFLWSLLPKKVNDAYRDIIGKSDMSDLELETQITLYKKKYEDALAGLDVFEGQALALGLTQEEYRDVVKAKGEQFTQAEKLVNDRIELVRSMMEKNIDTIETPADGEEVKAKFVLIDGFTIETPVQEIVDALQ